MRAIMVMYDSLSRRMLEPYGCDWVKTPNFSRLAKRAVTFDSCYVGSMPCMPARRELHTGRYNFLHRSWSPLEPFDDSMPQILRDNGVYTHLVSDHQHYWEDGGATYHNRYSSWEISRGQEGDAWKGAVSAQQMPMPYEASSAWGSMPLMQRMHKNDTLNRQNCNSEKKMPQAVTFGNGLEFIEANHKHDDWFLQIETFDPHEPFYTQPEWKALYPDDYEGDIADWPPYAPVSQKDKTSKDLIEHTRNNYAALTTMCDHYLGKVLDMMDKYNMWEDTMLIVNTDHGLLVGEHDWWCKSVMPMYNEIANTPLFVWNPKLGVKGVHRNSLVQTIDIPATILEFFEKEIPTDMQGKPLCGIIKDDTPIRKYGLFGYHGGHTSVVGDNKIYMRAPGTNANQPLYEYTLMPTHMRNMFKPEELQNLQFAQPFKFTKGCKTMKIATKGDGTNAINFGTLLFDLDNDPQQINPLQDVELECTLAREMVRLMQENEAPPEQYERIALPQNAQEITPNLIKETHIWFKESKRPRILEKCKWDVGAENVYWAAAKMLPPELMKEIEKVWPDGNDVTAKELTSIIEQFVPQDKRVFVAYFLYSSARTL